MSGDQRCRVNTNYTYHLLSTENFLTTTPNQLKTDHRKKTLLPEFKRASTSLGKCACLVKRYDVTGICRI